MSMRRRRNHDDEPSIGLDHIDIPFRDADPDSGETPVAELDSFVTPTRDDKGVGEPVHLSLPPIVVRHVDVLVKSNRFPYLRSADLIRHAIIRHIRWLTSIRQSIPRHMLVALEAMMEDCRDSEQRSRVEEVIVRIEDRVNHHLKRGETGEALRLVGILNARMENTVHDYWGTEVKKTLKKKFFEPMLKSGAVLTPTDHGSKTRGQAH